LLLVGVGGVHRGGENSMDISADLIELGKTPMAGAVTERQLCVVRWQIVYCILDPALTNTGVCSCVCWDQVCVRHSSNAGIS